MMHFRKKSSGSGDSNGNQKLNNLKLSKEDEGKLKIRSASVSDPILDAVHEAQPFEQAADAFHDPNRKSYFSSLDGTQQIMRDVFGQPIPTPDISNPTRARDERPLDTIRSFEYAVSGDPSWANQLETAQLGFRVRPDFPLMTTNPYGMDGGAAGVAAQPVYAEQAIYQESAAAESGGEKKKKKKRGFFGRKKKDD